MSLFKNLFGKKEKSCCDIQFEEVRQEENGCEAEEKTVDCCNKDDEKNTSCC